VGQPQVQLALYAPGVDPIAGTPVATSSPRGTLDALLEYDPTATGTYEVKVTTGPGLAASSANYTLVAVGNGSFEANGADGSFATAQDISGRPGVVGAQRQLTTTFVPAGSGGLSEPVGAVYGPDGNLYVASFGTNSILRYNSTTGAFLGTFVSSGSGGLNEPTGLFFSGGKLYVVSQGNNSVLRYDASSGAYIDTFVTSGSGGLSEAQRAAFGPDGNLYVSSGNTNSILRYSGSTGAFLNAFVAAGSGGLVRPHAILFAPDGNLYVASNRTNQVLRYNATTGAFVGVFVAAGSGGLNAPTDLTFGPDGNLYVSSWGNDRVLGYSGTTGAFIDAYVPPNDGGLTEPNALLFDASGSLYVASFNGNDIILRSSVSPDYYQTTLSAGQTVTFSTSTPGDGPGQPVNMLDPHIELYDPTQTLVATGTVLSDGRNESITYTAPTAGTYYVKVSRQNFTEGDYVLDPISSSPADKGFTPQSDSVFANWNWTPAASASSVSSNTGNSFAFQTNVFGVIEQNLSAWEDLITKERASLKQAIDQLFTDWDGKTLDSLREANPAAIVPGQPS
jgi:WD40 repeat protein